MTTPKKINSGAQRDVTTWKVIRAGDRDVEREQLNRILGDLNARLTTAESDIASIDSGGSSGINFDFNESQFMDDGGIFSIAGQGVTVTEINFTTFDTDNITEGSTNLYFTDERAQDAVGGILANSSNVTLTYADGTPSITGDLTNTTVTPGNYGSASAVGTFTVDAKGRLTAAANTSILITASQVSDFTEAAQDAVGAMVNATLSYDDGTPSLGINLANANTWAANQTFSSVDIDAGNIDGTVIGATTRAAGSFTTLYTSSTVLFDVNSASNAVEIRQIGSGNAFVVEDSTTPDATPFVIDGAGILSSGYTASITAGLGTAGRIGTFTNVANTGGGVQIFRYRATVGLGGDLEFVKSASSTLGTNTAVSSGHLIGTITFSAADGTGYVQAASIYSEVDGTVGTNDMPGRLVFATTLDGASSVTERCRISNDGTWKASYAVTYSGVISPSQLVANTDNWAPTGYSTCRQIRLSTDASRNITGVTALESGREIILSNVGSQDAVLVHDATSTAANRFLCPGSANFTLNANDSCLIRYDGTSSRWRVIAA